MSENTKKEIIYLCNLFLYQQMIQITKPYEMGQYPAPNTNKGGMN